MLENIRLSFQGIWSHKMRSFLTMLGIIIGIAAIIAIVSTIQGTNEQIKQNLIGSGTNSVVIRLYNGNYPIDPGYEMPETIPVLTSEIREQIEAIPEVSMVSFIRQRQEYDAVYRLGQSLSGGQVLGVDERYLDVNGYLVQKGRGFADSDFSQFRKVCLVDETTVDSLFPGENPVGKTLEIKGEPFTVVGVIGLSKTVQPVIHTPEDYFTYVGNESAGVVLVPDSAWPIIYRFDEPQSVVVKASSTDDMTQAGKKTADILNANAGLRTEDAPQTVEVTEGEEGVAAESNNYRYRSEDLLERAKQLQNLSNATNQMLIWIASISLLVGGIGVMNIMLVSVTERTREIGLKKAIGAQKSRILGQFLTEAGVLTSIGGIIGVLLGLLLARGISLLNGTLSSISVPAIIISVVFSMVIGIVFGLLPSVKAANLNPIEALRHE